MNLYDAYGKEIAGRRPVLEEIGGTSGVRQRYPGYPSQGLTPERLAGIFRDADLGDVMRQAELFEEMEEKDAHLGAVLQTRKLAVTGLDWEVLPASDGAEDRKAADFVREALSWVDGLDDAMMEMLDALGKGFSVSEIMWELAGDSVWVSDIRWRHPKRFTFRSPEGVLDVPRLLTDEEPLWGEGLVAGKYVFHRYKGRSGATARGGLLRPCAWMYLFKNYAVKDWVIFAERYAMPLRLGKYQPGASDDERRVLRNAVFNLGSDAAAVISDSTVIELLEQQSRGGSVEAYEKLSAFCNAAMSKAVLGHAASAESTPGRLGSETEAREVRRDLLRADARALERTIKLQLVRPLVAYNFGPDRDLPAFRFVRDEAEDLEKLARVYREAQGMGLAIGARHVHERFGIPVPEEGEEVLSPGASAGETVNETKKGGQDAV
jgi:phage gp29-like protein